MNNVLVSSGILIDTSSIAFERIGNCDTAGNRTSLVYFLHHVLFSRDLAKLVNIVDFVLVRDEAWATTRLTVLTNIDRSTFNAIVMTSCLVNRTSLISDIALMHVLISTKGFTTMATIIVHRARNDLLR
jgi:hypothetical protein